MATPAEMVTAIDAAIEGTLTANQQSYSINGRSLTRLSLSELLNARKYFVALQSEQAGTLRPAKVRFGSTTP